MTMSDTTSTTPDWAQLYHRNISIGDHQTSPANMFGTAVADSTIVTTNQQTLVSLSPKSSTGAIGNIEGRVSKSGTRRRSRASRKAPTTLLNTDTTNFRAMVQQFTGIPSAPYSSGGAIQTATGAAAPFINFGIGGVNDDHTINFTTAHHHHHHVHQQQKYYNNPARPQQQQGSTMFMLDNLTSNNNEGFFLDGDLPTGQTTAPPRPPSSNGFLF